MFLIAEIASAHAGDKNLFKNLIETAIKKDFTKIKIQIFSYSELVSIDALNQELLRDIEFSIEDWNELFSWLRSTLKKITKKVTLIAEPYGPESLKIAKESKLFSEYKVPTSDLSNLALVSLILKETNNLYLGTGGSNLDEIQKTIGFIRKENKKVNLKLIHGFQAYPTNVEDCDLWKINFLKKEFNINVGYADHLDASNEVLRILGSALAVANGADFIEKHLNLNREDKKPDFYSSLNPEEIENFQLMIKNTQELIKTNASHEKKFILNQGELNYRKNMKKYAVAARDISAKEIINMEDVIFKRVNKGEYGFHDVYKIIGKRANKEIKKDYSFRKIYLYE